MPKTAEQEKLEGYPGHRPVSKNAPVPDMEIPDPPKWMSRIAKRAYYDLVAVVGPEGMRVMAKSDKLALSMVCEAFAEWRECRTVLAKEGRYHKSGKIILDKEGNPVIEQYQIKRHPAVGDMQNAWSRLMTGLGKFGLTPYERQKVVAIAVPESGKPKEKSTTDKRKAALAAAKENAHLKAVNS